MLFALVCEDADMWVETDNYVVRWRLFARTKRLHIAYVWVATWQVCGVHKPGGSCASGEQLNECLQLCQQHAKAIVQTLKAAVAQPQNVDAA